MSTKKRTTSAKNTYNNPRRMSTDEPCWISAACTKQMRNTNTTNDGVKNLGKCLYVVYMSAMYGELVSTHDVIVGIIFVLIQKILESF